MNYKTLIALKKEHDAKMKKEQFGSCTFTAACEAVCPKEIPITNISRIHMDYLMGGLTAEK